MINLVIQDVVRSNFIYYVLKYTGIDKQCSSLLYFFEFILEIHENLHTFAIKKHAMREMETTISTNINKILLIIILQNRLSITYKTHRRTLFTYKNKFTLTQFRWSIHFSITFDWLRKNNRMKTNQWKDKEFNNYYVTHTKLNFCFVFFFHLIDKDILIFFAIFGRALKNRF